MRSLKLVGRYCSVAAGYTWVFAAMTTAAVLVGPRTFVYTVLLISTLIGIIQGGTLDAPVRGMVTLGVIVDSLARLKYLAPVGLAVTVSVAVALNPVSVFPLGAFFGSVLALQVLADVHRFAVISDPEYRRAWLRFGGTLRMMIRTLNRIAEEAAQSTERKKEELSGAASVLVKKAIRTFTAAGA
ncbi:MAG: hypothetical protein GXO28_05495 [Methanopyri archaeon]|nr:hypothetical protein [Methanopyri archaeon]